MKKFLLLLMFIPLVSFGQDYAKKYYDLGVFEVKNTKNYKSAIYFFDKAIIIPPKETS